MDDANRIYLFDTTLRDGQQCPGAGMTFEKNLEYARLSAELGTDVLEAGFPSASAVDFSIVNAIATELSPLPNSPVIAGLCQLRDEQIDRTIEALLPGVRYNKARLHVYLPVDPELMEASLGERAGQKAALVKEVHEFVLRAAKAGLEVEFSPEGYSRMGANFDFVTDCIRAAVSAGALVINCPDTIGGACSYEGEQYFVHRMNLHAGIMRKEFPGRTIIWSAHCHNDFGLATQNSLNAVFHGPARQVEGCINGVGERAGNAALEQVIMAIKHFGRQVSPNAPYYTNVRTELLQRVSDYVHRNMLPRQPHWSITGDNAAKHSAGGHTNAILRNPLAYQPFEPREVGKELSFLFGPLSGGNHAKSIIEKNGYILSNDDKAPCAQFIKEMFSDRRKGITDEELITGYIAYRSPMKIDEFDYARTSNTSSVKLKGEFFGRKGEIVEQYEGRDSALAALKKAIDREIPGLEIVSHRSISDGEGITARSVSTIVVTDPYGRLFEGRGIDQDIEISAMRALIDVANRAFVETRYRSDQAPAANI
jgi:2-isopropylmalate synthase